MLVVTTPELQGFTVRRYIGVVTGEAYSAPTSSATSSREFATSSADGQQRTRKNSGRRATCNPGDVTAGTGALAPIAVVGVDLTMNRFRWAGWGNVMVTASGTAIEIDRPPR